MSMNRAERRRLGKKEKVKTYTLSDEQLTRAVNDEVEKRLTKIKKEVTSEILKMSTMLSFGLSMKVLMDNYWKKSYKRRLPKFINELLDEFKKWEQGEISAEYLEEILWEIGGIKVK